MASDLSLSVILGAALGSTFKGVLGSASKSVGVLGAAVKQTHAQLNDVRAYQRNDAALDEMRVKLGETQRKVMDLRRALAADPSNAGLATQLEKAHNKAVKLSAALDAQRTKLREDGNALRKAGIDTRDLNSANERLTRTWEKQRAALAANGALLQKRAGLRATMLGQVAKLTGVFLAARPLAMWVGDAADFDARMQDIGNTADLTAAQIADLKKSIFDASQQTGRSIGDVQAGIGFLVAAGLDVGRARASIVSIGRTATAESANIEDLSKASFTLMDSMGIKPTGLADALDILTQSGKEGNVELRDMAAQLPVLGAQFRGLKMEGRDAVATLGAALEIARKGAADPAEAANNMRNFMAKVLSPVTLQKAKQNFGLDLYKIIQDAQKTGGNPFEASIKAIMHATGGDAKKMGELFTDMQVQNFLRPMMQNWKEYERIKNKALAAHGVVDKDFEKVGKTTNQQLARMGQAWDRFKKNVGTGLGAVFVNVFGWLTPLLNTVGDLAGKFPKLTATVIAATGAFVSFKAVVAGGRWLATFIPGVGKLSGVIRALVPGLGLAEAGVAALGGAFEGMSLAMLANPVGLAIGAVVAVVIGATLVIRKYWEPIKAFFTGVWQSISEAAGPVLSGIGQALAPLKPLWDGFVHVLSTVWHWFGSLLEPVHSTQEELDAATSKGRVFGQAIVGAFKMVIWPIRLGITLGKLFGRALGTAAGWVAVQWDGLKTKVEAIVNWIAAKIDWFVKKWDAAKGIVGAVWEKIQGAGGAVANAAGKVWQGVKQTGSPAGAVLGAAMAANAAAAPAIRNMPPPATRTPAPVVVQQGSTHINVHAAPGMDERALAKHVRQQLDERDRQQAARTRSKLGDHD